MFGPQTGLITVTIHNEKGHGIEFLLPPDENGRLKKRSRPTDAGPRTIERSLSKVELAALNAADKAPVTVKALAFRAGYKPGSYFSAAVTKLCRLGELIRVPDGVCRGPEA
jgi:hypothetical protein